MAPEVGPYRAPGTVARAARHGSGLYRRTLRAALKPIRSAETELRDLHAIEHEGDAPETPFIAMLGLILFFLPIFLVMAGLAFAAYYLA